MMLILNLVEILLAVIIFITSLVALFGCVNYLLEFGNDEFQCESQFQRMKKTKGPMAAKLFIYSAVTLLLLHIAYRDGGLWILTVVYSLILTVFESRFIKSKAYLILTGLGCILMMVMCLRFLFFTL